MEIKRNILFFVDKEKDSTIKGAYKPDGKLRLRIRYSSGKIDFNVGYRVDFDKWSTATRRCLNKTTHGKKKIAAAEINKEIQRLETLAENIFKSFEVSEQIPSIEEYRNAFNLENTKFTGKVNTKQSFFVLYDGFVKERGEQRDWSDASFEKYSSVKNHLEEFDNNIKFNDWTEAKLTEYVSFLRVEKEMKNSTIENQLDFLKAFLRWGYQHKNRYLTNNDFETFKPKLKKTQKKVIFLTWDELTKLKETEIPETKKYLERVRDVFLFQCFTGLRYSDVYNLKHSDIKEGYIEITTIKTTDSLTIELNKHSEAILDKYKHIPLEQNKALPVISNQKMNDYLKELAELAELNELVSETYFIGNKRFDDVKPKYALIGTHCGRRTFVCNALALGIPAQVVMKWTGHNDYKSMKPYIDVADKVKAEAMDKFNNV